MKFLFWSGTAHRPIRAIKRFGYKIYASPIVLSLIGRPMNVGDPESLLHCGQVVHGQNQSFEGTERTELTAAALEQRRLSRGAYAGCHDRMVVQAEVQLVQFSDEMRVACSKRRSKKFRGFGFQPQIWPHFSTVYALYINHAFTLILRWIPDTLRADDGGGTRVPERGSGRSWDTGRAPCRVL